MVVAFARVVARAVVAGRALARDALVSMRLPAVARRADVTQLYQRVVAEAGHPVPERAAVLVVVLPFFRVAALLAGFRVVPRGRGRGRRRRRERRRRECRVVCGFRDPQEQEEVSWCHAGSVLVCTRSETGLLRQQGSPRGGGVAATDRVDLYRGWGSVYAAMGLGSALRSAPPCGVEPSGSAIRRAMLELFELSSNNSCAKQGLRARPASLFPRRARGGERDCSREQDGRAGPICGT